MAVLLEVYNILGRGLLVFSVLPDFYSDSNWSVIDSADVLKRRIQPIDLKYIHSHPYLKAYPMQTNTLEFKLVKIMDGKFYARNLCLTEVYLPMKYGSSETCAHFNAIQGVLNIRQPLWRMRQMMEEVWPNMESLKGQPFPMEFRGWKRRLPNQHNFMREYLSKSFALKGDTVCQFWLFAGWNTNQGYEEVLHSVDGKEAYYHAASTSYDEPSYHRGNDRMLYIPEKGVVGGSYDFYFIQPYTMEYKGYAKPRPRTTKSKEELFQNMLEERVMLAEELK